jgi:hypothetical protein
MCLFNMPHCLFELVSEYNPQSLLFLLDTRPRLVHTLALKKLTARSVTLKQEIMEEHDLALSSSFSLIENLVADNLLPLAVHEKEFLHEVHFLIKRVRLPNFVWRQPVFVFGNRHMCRRFLAKQIYFQLNNMLDKYQELINHSCKSSYACR